MEDEKLKNKRSKKYLLYILIIILSLSTVSLGVSTFIFYQHKLKWYHKWYDDYTLWYNNYLDLNKTSSEKIQSLENEISDLSDKVSKLNLDKVKLESENKNLQNLNEQQRILNERLEKEISDQEKRMQEILNEANEIKNELYSLKDWVSDNAMISDNIYSEIAGTVGIDYVTSYCEILVDRMGVYMYSLGFTYQLDIESTGGKEDRLFSINDFWSTKKGDCEDFALFYAGWLRKVIDNLNDICSNPKLVYEGYPLDISNKKVYVVCGKTNSGTGHCVVGFTDLYPEDSGFLDDLKLIEPQNGGFLGTVNDNFETVWYIISENDFYDFYPEITSLQDHINSIQQLISQIEEG